MNDFFHWQLCMPWECLKRVQKKRKIKSISNDRHTIICVLLVKIIQRVCLRVKRHQFPGSDQQESWSISPEWWLIQKVGGQLRGSRGAHRAKPQARKCLGSAGHPRLLLSLQTEVWRLPLYGVFGNVFMSQVVLLSQQPPQNMANQGLKGTNGILGEEPQIYTSTKRALITKLRTMNKTVTS